MDLYGIFIWAGRGKDLSASGITSIPHFWGDGEAGTPWETDFPAAPIIFRKTPGKLQGESVGSTHLGFFRAVLEQHPKIPCSPKQSRSLVEYLEFSWSTATQNSRVTLLGSGLEWSHFELPEFLIPVATASFLWISLHHFYGLNPSASSSRAELEATHPSVCEIPGKNRKYREKNRKSQEKKTENPRKKQGINPPINPPGCQSNLLPMLPSRNPGWEHKWFLIIHFSVLIVRFFACFNCLLPTSFREPPPR